MVWHLTRPDLFPGSSVDDDESYPSEWQRGSEAFARACDADPIDLAVQEFAESCGWPPQSARDAFLLDVIYPGGRALAGTDRRVAVTVEPPMVYEPEAEAYVQAVGGSDAHALVVVDGGSPELRRVDPFTGAEVERVSLPGDDWGAWEIISGDGLVIAAQGGATERAWLVGATDVTSLEGFPGVERTGPTAGAIAAGRAWVNPEGAWATLAVNSYAFADGISTEFAWPDGVERAVPSWTTMGGQVFALTYDNSLDAQMFVLDPDVGELSGFPLHRSLFLSGLAHAADQWVVAVASVPDQKSVASPQRRRLRSST